MLIDFKLCFDDEANKFVAVDVNTGEVKDFVAPVAKKTSTTRKKKVDECSTPQLTLSDNKYTLNTAAVELMGVEPDAKLCIKMRKVDGQITPILGTIEAFKVKDGNRLTKSYTVACRGANNDALAAYGNIFELVANPDIEGTFILKGDKTPTMALEDENIDTDVPLPEGLNVDLETLNSDIPQDAEEISGSMFEAMLQGVEV